MQEERLRTIIITPPISNAGVHPLSNLVDIMSEVSDSVSLITGTTDLRPFKKTKSDIQVCKIPYSVKSNGFAKILNHIYLQLVISQKLIKFSNRGNILIFFLDSHAYNIPVLMGRLLRKKIIFLLAASISGSSETKSGFFTKASIFSESVNFRMADRIIVYSPALTEKWNLQNYAAKIRTAHEHFLFQDKFGIKNKLDDRPPLVGYIGRLCAEKGVARLIQALPAIFSCRNKKFRVMIGGDGPLKRDIVESIEEQKLTGRVDITGRISHDDLPEYLNRLRLLIIPSYSEGLPNIMLEAMACGTPVLATPVGAITDFIEDKKTGFIMKNNSPECIAENINRALDDPDLGEIVSNAKNLVDKEFTFDSTVAQWREDPE